MLTCGTTMVEFQEFWSVTISWQGWTDPRKVDTPRPSYKLYYRLCIYKFFQSEISEFNWGHISQFLLDSLAVVPVYVSSDLAFNLMCGEFLHSWTFCDIQLTLHPGKEVLHNCIVPALGPGWHTPCYAKVGAFIDPCWWEIRRPLVAVDHSACNQIIWDHHEWIHYCAQEYESLIPAREVCHIGGIHRVRLLGRRELPVEYILCHPCWTHVLPVLVVSSWLTSASLYWIEIIFRCNALNPFVVNASFLVGYEIHLFLAKFSQCSVDCCCKSFCSIDLMNILIMLYFPHQPDELHVAHALPETFPWFVVAAPWAACYSTGLLDAQSFFFCKSQDFEKCVFLGYPRLLVRFPWSPVLAPDNDGERRSPHPSLSAASPETVLPASSP